jgi:NADH-quinone oxidoreductase subunit F
MKRMTIPGYRALEKAFREMTSEEILEEVKKSNLQGRGGAGFPAGIKWGFLPPPDGRPRYLVVNADEGEPATFKDRAIMENDPHMLLEGIIISAYAIGVHRSYIYIRGEYQLPIRRIEDAIAEAIEAGYVGENILGTGYRLEVTCFVGVGAYICGEEMALLESIEGKKGWPRLKPPYPAHVGLFGCPTIVNNVETLAYIPHIVERGGEAVAAIGTPKNGGTKLYSVSGHVERPGVYELPMGSTLREVIAAAGGVSGGKAVKAVIPGGASSAILTRDDLDISMDFTSLAEAGSMLGSAGVVVMDEETDLVDLLKVLMEFFAHESCGQCTPCREGTAWSLRILQRICAGKGTVEDLDVLIEIAENMTGTTICPMGPGAAAPLRSFVERFRDEFETAVSGRDAAAGLGSPVNG